MNIQVTPHTIAITINNNINAGEYNITPCEFTFTEEYENLTKEAIFSSCDGSVIKTSILNNQCTIPFEVLQQEGNVLLGVYAYETDNDELVLRYSPTPQYFNVKKGSFQVGNDPDLPSSTEWERVLEQINQAIEETNNLNITANKEGKVTTITITKKDGTTQEVEILDGVDGVSLENIEIVNRNLKVTYGGETENLGQVAPNIQVGTTTTGSPSSQASVVNVGTDLNPILNFTIPKGEAGSIKFEIVEQLPTQDIKEDTIYLVPYTKITVQTLPTENIQLHTIYIIENTGKRYVYNGNEWIEISNDNQYIEYVYINNSWEELGSIGVDINLDDYYTKTETNTLLNDKVGFTDYATANKGGVIKGTGDYSFRVDNQGRPNANVLSYSDYSSYSTNNFISKGTLENVITGKGLVSNTDYASSSTGGVIKVNDAVATQIGSTGNLIAQSKTYEQYLSLGGNMIIGKTTLENVITGKDLTTKAYVDGLVGDIESILEELDIGGGV